LELKKENKELRKEIRGENERLIKKFYENNAKLNKCLTEKMRTETSKFCQSIENLKDNTDKDCSELESQITSLNNEVNSRIDRVVIDTKELTENIAIEMDGELTEVAKQVAANKEHLEGRVT
jgi:hypothetical protein